MKEIFEDAISKGHDSIAIFDDDFVFSNSFDHCFSKLTEFIGDEWDVIYLGASQWLWDEVNFLSKPFYAPDKNTNGSFAVIYRKSIFVDIVQKINEMKAPFDAGPLRDIVLGESLQKSFVAYPNLVIANVEKEGIRDSRNQKEFSKRFRWELENFPAWFTEWSPCPTVLLDTNEGSAEEYNGFVTAVTTINRKEYLQNFIQDWTNTRDEEKNRTLIVADDGSTDGTLEWLCEDLEIPGTRLVVIRNDSLGIARQTNSILEFVTKMKYPPAAIFMCNDDIRFLQNGWDKEYFNAMRLSGFDHLVYFNPDWKKPSHQEYSPSFPALHSSCSAREAMGCFYTLTPNLISQIGFFDEDSFPVRGHSHIDYTIRACRCEANDSDFLYDIENSNSMIGMVLRDGYKRTHRVLSVWERKVTTSDAKLSRREEILSEEGRIFVNKGW